MSPSAISLTIILAIVALGAAIGFLAGVAAQDGPGTMDRWRPRLRRGADVSADGRRSLHHLLFLGSQRLGLFPRRPDSVHHGLPHAGLRRLVLHPAADLGSGPEARAADAIRLLQHALRQQVPGRICVRGRHRLPDPLPAAATHGTGHYRLGGQFRWHRPYTRHGGLGGPAGRICFCQRRPRRGLGQRPEGCVDGVRRRSPSASAFRISTLAASAPCSPHWRMPARRT